MSTTTIGLDHEVVSREQWLAARTALLAREKALTRLRDELARQRQALPWVEVDKQYMFDTPEGPRTLGELFGGTRGRQGSSHDRFSFVAPGSGGWRTTSSQA